MQGKGLIKLFLILTTLICLLQVLYFLPTNKVERKADDYAQSKVANLPEGERFGASKLARANYLDSMSSETIFSIPGLTKYTYSDLKRQQLGLGLDLKGGMSVVLEVDLEEFLTNLAGRNGKDPDFVAALAAAKVRQKSDQSDFVTLFVSEFKRIAPTKKLANIFDQSEGLNGEINFETSDGQVERILRDKANETVNLTFKMLNERIDKLGVVQPNVSLDAARDLILVEMPGVDNPERARNMLQSSAQLEFWETYRVTDSGILTALQEADRRLKGTEASVIDSLMTGTDSLANAGAGPLRQSLVFNGEGGTLLYSANVLGLADKNKRNTVMEYLQKPEIRNLFPKNLKFMWGYKPFQNFETGEFTGQYELYAVKTVSGSEKAPLEGDVVVQAGQSQNPTTGEPTVTLAMNAVGSRKWAEITDRAYKGNAEGAQREIAVSLDQQVVTTPGVRNGAITGGNTEISGSFTVQEAVDLANVLEVGKLPAKLKIIQESNVGPTLGKENIKKSLNSLLIGFGVVLMFMILYYMGGGIVSVISLLLNIFFIFGALSSFGTVLTLPGLAGIVLTIGMAVDANVIIYERIREELRSGKTLSQAVSDGFSNSYSAIIDANVTTILTAIVLAVFGLGPVKGFAVVLIIGVLSSMFTAVLVGRLMIESYIDGGKRDLSFWNTGTKNFLSNLNIDWIGKRKLAYTFSSILILVGLASILFRGFDLGVDFKGGHSYTVQIPNSSSLSIDDIKGALSSSLKGEPVVKRVEGDTGFKITTTYMIDDESAEASDKVTEALLGGLSKLTNQNISLDQFKNNNIAGGLGITSYSKVGPTIADDITKSSFYAGIIALLLIFLYITFRFSKWQFSFGAVVALFHDTLITLGMFSLLKGIMPFSLEIDQAFIAAILTVIGYSINDTVIIFDRIREYMGLYPDKPKDEVFNLAINSTLSRTNITSLTTLFVVLVLLVFGGSSIKGFAFAIFIGILVGTYSSIFIASPIVRDLLDRDKVKGQTKPVSVDAI